MRWSIVLLRALATFTLAALAGCAGTPTPEGFLEVDSSGSTTKAVAADESLFWSRTFSVPDDSDFGFWREALQNELVGERGHTILDEKPTTVDGHDALELTIEGTFGGEVKRYWLVFWLTTEWRSTVHTIEYVADKADFDKHIAAVRVAAGIGT